MKRLLLAAALGLGLTFAAQAKSHDIGSCGLDSDYDVTLDTSGLSFRHSGGKPESIVMNKGQLIVDGRSLSISDADRARIAEYEATVRALYRRPRRSRATRSTSPCVAVTEVAAVFPTRPTTRARASALPSYATNSSCASTIPSTSVRGTRTNSKRCSTRRWAI